MSKTSFSRKPRTRPKVLKHRPLPHYELDARLFRILTLAALVGVALLPWLQAKNPTCVQSELRDGDDWGALRGLSQTESFSFANVVSQMHGPSGRGLALGFEVDEGGTPSGIRGHRVPAETGERKGQILHFAIWFT